MKLSEIVKQKIVRPFEGRKVSMEKMVGQPFTILDFELRESKRYQGTQYLCLQVMINPPYSDSIKDLEHIDKPKVINTGSKWLKEVIKGIDKSMLPIEDAVIMKDYKGYYFKGTVENEE